MEEKRKKIYSIPIEDILVAFNIKADKMKDWIHYNGIKDVLEIEVEEVNEK